MYCSISCIDCQGWGHYTVFEIIIAKNTVVYAVRQPVNYTLIQANTRLGQYYYSGENQDQNVDFSRCHYLWAQNCVNLVPPDQTNKEKVDNLRS